MYLSKLELRPRERVRSDENSQSARTFLDFVVNRISLYELIGRKRDLITGLWVQAPNPFNYDKDEARKYLERLTLKAPADFPNERRSLYICSECGDRGCGAITVVVEEGNENVVWKDFGYENEYEDVIQTEEMSSIGPFRFSKKEYLATLQNVLP